MSHHALGELAHWIGLVPLLWLVLLDVRDVRRDAAWWWIAGALGVSWLADTAAHWVNPDLVGNVFPLAQTALIGAVVLSRAEALRFVGALLAVALVDIGSRGPLGADVLVATVANGAVVGLAWRPDADRRLRGALLVYFGLGLFAWWAFALSTELFHLGIRELVPAWPTWLAYQATRALGIGLFCWASRSSGPPLRLARTG